MEPGTVIAGRYKLITRAGEGGMAEVWRAEALGVAGFRKRVALKRIHGHLADVEAYRAMFVREACLAAELDHANIVQVFDLGEDASGLYLVMEWVEGVTLKDIEGLCTRYGVRLSPALGCGIGISVLRALEAAHARTARRSDGSVHPSPVIHRDISPSNVLLSVRGDVKLGDFGLARALDGAGFTPDGIVKGKLAYLSPETLRGHPVSTASDLYAVAVLVWEMLAGRRLYAGLKDGEVVEAIVRREQPLPVRSQAPDVPEAVAAVVERGLSPEVGSRWPSASVFARALGDVLRRLPERTDPTRIAREVQSARVALGKLTSDRPLEGASVDGHGLETTADLHPKSPVDSRSLSATGQHPPR